MPKHGSHVVVLPSSHVYGLTSWSKGSAELDALARGKGGRAAKVTTCPIPIALGLQCVGWGVVVGEGGGSRQVTETFTNIFESVDQRGLEIVWIAS